MNAIQKISFFLLLSFSFSLQSQTLIEVSANSDWTGSGFFRASSDEVIICSGGEVRGWPTVNPECWRWVTPSGFGRVAPPGGTIPCPTCPVVSLIAKIGENGTPFYVGDRCVIQPSVTSASGELFFRINDASIADNTGYLQVVISKNCNDLSSCFETPTPTPGTISINGNADWTPTGLTRSAGEEVIICGKGEVKAWNFESECWRTVTPSGLGRFNFVSTSTPCTTCPVLCLIGKIGVNGTPFYVGNRGVIQTSDIDTGAIFLRINDASLTDNSGAWAVSLSKNCAEIADCFEEQVVSTENLPTALPSPVTIYPNPASSMAHATITVDHQQEIVINMLDLSGILLYRGVYSLTTGENSLPLVLPSGIENRIVIIQTILDNRYYTHKLHIK